MIQFLWILTLTSAIWTTALPGFSLPFLGYVYPYRILVVILIIFILFKGRVTIPSLLFRKTLFVFGTIVIYAIGSVMFSSDIVMSINKLVNYLINISFLFLTLIVVKNKVILNQTFQTLYINYIILLVVGIFESFFGVYYFYNGDVFLHRLTMLNLNYPLGPTNNTNDFALLLITLLPFVIYHIEEKKSKKFLFPTIFLSSFFLILNSESKLVLIALGMYILLYIFDSQNLSNKLKKMVPISLILIVLIINHEWIDLLINDFSSLSLSHGSASERMNLMINSMKILKRSYFLGVGVGMSPYYMVNSSGLINVTGGSVHNFWIEFMVEFGFINFSLLIWWFSSILIKNIQLKRKLINPRQKLLVGVSINSLIIFTLSSIAASSATTLPYVWMMFGLASCIPYLIEKCKLDA